MNLETLVLPMKSEDNAFRASLSRVTQLVTGAIQAVEGMVKASFEWADQLDSITDVMDVSNDKAAAYNFILRKSGTATETFSKGMVILGKGLVDASGKLDSTGKALGEWGINVLDSNNMLKDQETLIGEVADKYGTFATQQEKVNFLTEVFGKSGADLVDFFDTLAADGGIDAVTKRVKDLGLAIDPDRYEAFGRSLEEVKLIGLSLAVGFTEKLMPILEKAVNWITEEGIPGFLKFKDGLVSAFESGGIQEALSFLDDEISLAIESIDWETLGTTFGDLIEGMLTNSAGEIDVPASLSSFGEALKTFFTSAIGEENLVAFKEHFVDYILLQLADLDVKANDIFLGMDTKINATVLHMLDTIKTTNKTRLEEIKTDYGAWGQSVDASFANWSVKVGGTFTKWASDTGATFSKWSADTLAEIGRAMDTLKNRMDAKSSAITEIFTSRFGSIPRKAAEAFDAGRNALIGVVQAIVTEINKILAKIKTSFGLTFTGVNMGSGSIGTSSTANLGASTGNTTTGGVTGTSSGRASGGPVIKGQSYQVFDTHQDEVLRLGANGRIDTLATSSKPSEVSIVNWGDFDVPWLASEIVKAMNNA